MEMEVTPRTLKTRPKNSRLYLGLVGLDAGCLRIHPLGCFDRGMRNPVADPKKNQFPMV